MEHIDRDKAQRVWQRVQSQTPQASTAPAMTPDGLILEELTDQGLYRQLARQNSDHAAALGQLSQQSRHRASVLRGICKLSGLSVPAQMPKANRQENLSAALRLLMGRLLRRRTEYERLCDHEEFGPLYRRLMEHTADSATALAVLIGK